MLKVLQQLMSGPNAMQPKDIGVITPYSGQVHLWPCDLSSGASYCCWYLLNYVLVLYLFMQNIVQQQLQSREPTHSVVYRVSR